MTSVFAPRSRRVPPRETASLASETGNWAITWKTSDVLVHQFACQPSGATEYRSLLSDAIRQCDATHVDFAFAYATVKGIEALIEAGGAALDRCACRWLIGADWCRTDPLALDLLSARRRTTVRIADGDFVVARKGCTPRLPFHPKATIIRGEGVIGVIEGSGNASLNGMTKGHEVGSLLLIAAPANATERLLASHCGGVATWFNSLWTEASPLAGLKAEYAERHAANVAAAPTVTDDDTTDAGADRRGALSPIDLVRLRTANNLWIEAGTLSENRGRGVPGDQLMMKRNTRVFFNLQAIDVPENTNLGHVAIRYGTGERPSPTASLRFSDNSMDVLTLPVPSAGGPESYDEETLRFERCADRQGAWYQLSLGTNSEVRRWKTASAANNALFRMTSGRQFGAF